MFRRLLVLNGIAALLVPLQHSGSYGLMAMFFWTNRYRPVTVPNFDQLETFAYHATIVLRQASSFAIPGFLFVSGCFVAFLVRGTNARLEWSPLFARIRKLVPPFLIWSPVVFLVDWRMPTLEQVLDQYYYIPVIVQLYLLSPLLARWAKSNGKLLLIGTGLIQYGLLLARALKSWGLEHPVNDLIISCTPIWFFPGLIFFFALGIVCGLHLGPLKEKLARYRWQLLILALALGVLACVEFFVTDQIMGSEWIGPRYRSLSRTLYETGAIFALLAFPLDKMPGQARLSKIAGKSLGIYLANSPVIYMAASVFFWKAPWLLGYPLTYQAALFAIGLLAPLLMMAVVQRFFRGFYGYVFG